MQKKAALISLSNVGNLNLNNSQANREYQLDYTMISGMLIQNFKRMANYNEKLIL